MLKYLKLSAAVFAVSATPAFAEKLGLGRVALPEEIAAWDVDVSPDGTGLPAGSGDVWTGEEVFAEKCGVCHGDFAEGVGNWPKLAGGADTLADKDPLKTVGSYWPYLSTTWDYVNRSMPFGEAQTLEADEVYAIVAYILYSNDLVDDDFVLSNETFLSVEMPNADGFVLDDRATAEAHFIGEPCMSGCLDGTAAITKHVVFKGDPNSPDDPSEEAAKPEPASEEEPVVVAEEAEPETETAAAVAALDPELVKAGEKVFRKCKSCHQVGEGAKNKTGPQLNGIMGRTAGALEGYKFSKAMIAKGDEGLVWDAESMGAFLTKPKAYIKKTKMSFSGLKKEKDINAIVEYLKSVSQ